MEAHRLDAMKNAIAAQEKERRTKHELVKHELEVLRSNVSRSSDMASKDGQSVLQLVRWYGCSS